jgi:sec-independent protein translocase protein TatA
MPNLGFPEIMLILVVVLLLFGAKRLPEIGASFGKGIREFKRSMTETSDALNAPSNPDQSSRQIDGAGQQAPTSGEPKRLSQ